MGEARIPARPPGPLQELVLLQARPSAEVSLLASDPEITFWLRSQAQVGQSGATLLPARPLLAFLREPTAEQVHIGLTGTNLLVRAEGVTYQLPCSDPAGFPSPGPFPTKAHALLSPGPLRLALGRTLFAAARGSGYYRDFMLEAVLLEITSAGLRLVASDNRRLAVAEVSFLSCAGKGLPSRLLLSVRSLALLGRLAQGEEPVRVFLGSEQVFFRVGEATLATRPPRGRYPDWRAALPPNPRRVADLRVGALLSGVRQAAVLRERLQARLELRLQPGRLVLESKQAGAGCITVEQEVDYAGPVVSWAFNPVLVLDLLRALEEEGTVGLEMDSSSRAVLFVGSDGYRHVLVPLRSTSPGPDPAFRVPSPGECPATALTVGSAGR